MSKLHLPYFRRSSDQMIFVHRSFTFLLVQLVLHVTMEKSSFDSCHGLKFNDVVGKY